MAIRLSGLASGFGLTLENMTDDDIKVKGKIESIDIERTID